MIWTFLLGQRRKEISFVKLCLHSSPPMSQFFSRIIQKIIQPFLKPKSCKKLLQFPKFPSSLCEKTFLYVFFPATQLSALLLPIHSVRKTRVPYLIRLQKHSRRLQSLHAFQKTKPYYTYYNKLTTIENHWKVAKRFLWKLPEIILELKNYTLQITNLPIKMPAIKKSIQIFAHSQSFFFSLVCKVHNCHVGDHQILSFFLLSACVFSIYWALLQCIQFSSLKPSLKYNL